MMMKYIFILFFFLGAGSCFAQVGINTTSVLLGSTFYIEGGNPANISDDVVVTTIGNMGLGKNPLYKLDVKGGIIYNNNNNNNRIGQYLVSDNSGNASWRFLSLGKGVSEWKLTNTTGIYFSSAILYPLTGTGSFPINELGLTLSGSSVIVPKGRYMIFLKGDMEGAEYGSLRIVDDSTNAVIYSMHYGWELSGSADIVEFNTDVSLSLSYTPRTSVRITKNPVGTGAPMYLSIPYTAKYTYSIFFLRLYL